MIMKILNTTQFEKLKINPVNLKKFNNIKNNKSIKKFVIQDRYNIGSVTDEINELLVFEFKDNNLYIEYSSWPTYSTQIKDIQIKICLTYQQCIEFLKYLKAKTGKMYYDKKHYIEVENNKDLMIIYLEDTKENAFVYLDDFRDDYNKLVKFLEENI